jgi:hypothetical protein
MPALPATTTAQAGAGADLSNANGRRAGAAICDGGKEGVMLYPSACPLTWMSDRCRENCIQYIESGLKYGEL